MAALDISLSGGIDAGFVWVAPPVIDDLPDDYASSYVISALETTSDPVEVIAIKGAGNVHELSVSYLLPSGAKRQANFNGVSRVVLEIEAIRFRLEDSGTYVEWTGDTLNFRLGPVLNEVPEGRHRLKLGVFYGADPMPRILAHEDFGNPLILHVFDGLDLPG